MCWWWDSVIYRKGERQATKREHEYAIKTVRSMYKKLRLGIALFLKVTANGAASRRGSVSA